MSRHVAVDYMYCFTRLALALPHPRPLSQRGRGVARQRRGEGLRQRNEALQLYYIKYTEICVPYWLLLG